MFSCQVFFFYIALFTIPIVSKQLYSIKLFKIKVFPRPPCYLFVTPRLRTACCKPLKHPEYHHLECFSYTFIIQFWFRSECYNFLLILYTRMHILCKIDRLREYALKVLHKHCSIFGCVNWIYIRTGTRSDCKRKHLLLTEHTFSWFKLPKMSCKKSKNLYFFEIPINSK